MSPPSASEPSTDDRVERFRRDLIRALGREVAADDRVALAVSGGPDSMAMLWLAARAWPGQVVAATVDHHLRPESAGEAAMVARWGDVAGVPHATLTVEASRAATGNLHAWARQERYDLLRRWAHRAGAAALCTAHHLDDQAETFLMRAARGAGIAGLAAIRERHVLSFPVATDLPVSTGLADGGPTGGMATMALLRPLLGWRRADLRGIAVREDVPFVDDPSNVDARFQRSRLRAWLAEAPWLDAGQIARTARQVAAVNDDLEALGKWLWSSRAAQGEREVRVDMADLPREIRRRLARMAVIAIESEDRDARSAQARHADANLEPLLDALERGGQAMQGDVLASAHGSLWHFRPAPPRRS